LELARQEAPRLNHGFVGTEHVLLGLLALEDGVVPNVFKKMGVDREGVRREIENWVSSFPPSKMPGRLPYTPRVEKSLRLAATEANVSKHGCIGAEHILLGLVLEGDGVAGRVLRDFGFSPETTREEIMRDVGRNRCGSMDEQLEKRLRFLRKANTEGMPHSDRGLLDHLLGTRQLLVEWEARPALCDAGLFHSVYGTESYELKAIPLTMRNEVQQLIGEEAESLAWLFCMMRRETLFQNPGREGELRVQHRLTDEWLPLTKIQFQDLLTMTIANTLEAFPHCSWFWRRYLRMGLRQYRDIAIPPAQRAIDRIDIHWWEIWK
jgi:ATP-dependent Clp protease ATP-binding subunit ClpA